MYFIYYFILNVLSFKRLQNGVLVVLNLKVLCECLTMLVFVPVTFTVIHWSNPNYRNRKMMSKCHQPFRHSDIYSKKKNFTDKGEFNLKYFQTSKTSNNSYEINSIASGRDPICEKVVIDHDGLTHQMSIKELKF